MSRWWERAWAAANTPLDARQLATLLRELATPGTARALWTAPVSALWQRIQVPQPDELTAVVPRPLQAEALARLRAEPPDAESFNHWRADSSYRPVLLARVDLRNRDLRGYNLRGCILYGADLRGADLRGCLLDGAILKSARIAGASLEENTLEGHDLEEFADAFENQDFTGWVRSLDKRVRTNLVSVTEADRKFKKRKQLMVCELKFRSNVRNPLRLRAWLENGVTSEKVSDFVLEGHRSHRLVLSVERKKYTPDRPIKLTLYLDGLNEPLTHYNFWAWERV